MEWLNQALALWLEWIERHGRELTADTRAAAERTRAAVESTMEERDTFLASAALTRFAREQGIRSILDLDAREGVPRGDHERGPEMRGVRSPNARGIGLRPRGVDVLESRGGPALWRVLLGNVGQALAQIAQSPEVPPALVTYPEVRAPQEVRARTTFQVHVAARPHPTQPTASRVELPRERPGAVDLEVAVELPDDALEPADKDLPLEQPLRVHENGGSAEITFDLFAVGEGAPRFDVVFRQGGAEGSRVERARVGRRIVVLPENAAPGDVAGRPVVSPVGPVTAGDPSACLLLRVHERATAGDVRLVRVTLGGAAWRGAPVEHLAELPREAWRSIADLCRDLPDATLRDPAAAETRLENIGAALGERLLGREILRALAVFPEGTPLHVESDDAWVPWELVYVRPFGVGGDFFVGQHLAVTRWLRAGHARDVLPVERCILVAPRSSGLLVAAERRALASLLSAPDERASIGEVQGRLQGAVRAVVHFACHGASRPGAPFPEDLEMDGGALTVVDVPRAGPGEAGPLDGSLVFVNACEAGLATPSLWGVGGWAEAFLRAGAGGFVAPSWSVGDGAAASFASSFYEHAGRGVALGEAARLARKASRRTGVSYRLAYAVHAPPGARIVPARDAAVARFGGAR